jgi:hypothetical protein
MSLMHEKRSNVRFSHLYHAAFCMDNVLPFAIVDRNKVEVSAKCIIRIQVMTIHVACMEHDTVDQLLFTSVTAKL